MAFFTTKRSLLVACAALLTVGLFQSCSDSPSTMSNKDIADLQKQLVQIPMDDTAWQCCV